MNAVKEEQMDVYLQAFNQLPQRVVIKSKRKLPPTKTNNSLVLEWIPQNDLLGKLCLIKL